MVQDVVTCDNIGLFNTEVQHSCLPGTHCHTGRGQNQPPTWGEELSIHIDGCVNVFEKIADSSLDSSVAHYFMH